MADETEETDPLLDGFMEYVGAQKAKDRVNASRRLAEARAAVGSYLVDSRADLDAIPDPIYESAVFEVGSKLWGRQRDQTGAGAQFGEVGRQALPIPRDPLVTARPLLAPYVAGGFA